MVLEQGRIIERGTHDKLIEQKGRYYQLYTGNAIANSWPNSEAMCILSDTSNFGGSFPHKISIFCNLSVGAHSVRPILLHGIVRCTTLPVNNRFFVHNNTLLLPCRIKIHFAALSIFLSEVTLLWYVRIGAIHIDQFRRFYVIRHFTWFRIFVWIAPFGCFALFFCFYFVVCLTF